MANKRLVIALGGNALGNTPEEQLELVHNTAAPIVDLIEEGFDVIVTHGNGPQVGMIKVATDNSATKVGGTPSIPFPECGAMSQGYIGYHLQQAMQREFARRGMDKACASIVTQTVVDAADPAFQDPTKPVGAFFTEEEAAKLMEETGNKYVEDAGRGWRWVVASPAPVRIVELPLINNLSLIHIYPYAVGKKLGFDSMPAPKRRRKGMIEPLGWPGVGDAGKSAASASAPPRCV